jgi:sortase (surface protein transpeptidase)
MMPMITLQASDAAAKAAQDDGEEQQCDPGFVLDEQSGECVPEQEEQPECEEGQVYDSNLGYCVDDPSQQEEEEPVGVQVEKYDCPAGYDAYSASLDDLRSQCPANQNPVQLTHGSNVSQEQGSSTTGYAEWLNEPAGSHYVYEDIPEGYGQPVVWCGVYVPQQSQPSANQMNVQNGNAVSWDLQPGEYLYCWWFNVPEDEGYGTIHITKYDCEGYQEDPQSASYEDLQGACTETLSNVGFELFVDQQQVDQSQSDGGGQAQFDQVPIGTVTVAEQLPDGYEFGVLYCYYHPQDAQNSVGSPDPVSLQDGYFFDWNMEAGYILDCFWFNFPEDGGTSWIDFYKYECAFDESTSEDTEYYLQNCAPVEGWNFDVHWDGGGSTETTDSEGYASWSGVPTGQWTASESLPEGYGQPIVYCRFVEWPDEANYDNDWFPYDPSGGEFTYEFEYGDLRIECYWFNFAPEDDYNWIDFYKYVCPFDAPTDAEIDYYQENCQPREGWDFNLEWDGGGGGTQTTDGSGAASWSGVPTGEWTGSETLPEGYGQPIVWCRYIEWPDEADEDGSWFRNEAPDGVYEGNFEYDNVRIECYWFNFEPEDNYNWIDFYKYSCPFDAPHDADKDYYEQNCEPVEGWDFDVQWEGGGGPQTTDSEGHASWSGVPVGEWSGSETVPEGYGEPVVWCRYVEWPDEAGVNGDWARFDAPGGTYENGFGYDEMRIECHWYNFTPDGGSWIDVYKYYCPEGTLYDTDPATLAEDCTLTADVTFDVTSGSYSQQQTTDQTGYATWAGVPTGQWSATETIPDGYGDPIVYCRYTEWPDEATDIQDTTFLVESPGGTWSGEFDYDGVRIVCGVFNIPDDDYNWIDFYKYECGFDEATGEDAEYYQQNCEPVEGWDFDVQWEGGGSTQTTDASGAASWSGVPIGTWTGSETLPEGYGEPIVYCRYVEWPDEAGYDNAWQSFDAADGSFEHGFEYDNVRIECYWFNFGAGDNNWVDFYKYWCPEGTPYDADREYYEQNCSVYTEGVDYDLTWTDGGATGTTDQEGYYSASDVPTGPWQAQETIPETYGDPVVWCHYTEWPDESGETGEWTSHEAPGGYYQNEFEYGGMRIECYWYNIPYQQNWVDVTKWWCAETVTTPYEQSADNLLEECERYTEGVDLNLEWTGGSEQKTTDGEGNAEWGELPSGPWSLHETVPDGYGDPVVWCRWIEWPETSELTSDPFKYQAPHGSFSGEFDGGGYRIHCDIFNIPAYDPGWITVYKWYCAVGVPTDSSAEYLRDTCDTVTTGVNFSLTYGETSVPMTTDSEGKAEWGDVPTGDWSLEETSASSYGEPVIWCQWVSWPEEAGTEYTQDLYQPEAADAAISGTHQYPGMRLVCYWFNFGYEGGDNWITFYKYYCEPGSAWGEALEAWQENCQQQDGVEFTLDNEQGSFPRSTSGGMTEWTDIEDGPLTVQESLPTGYEDPRIWCYRVEYTPGEDAPAFQLADFEQASAPGGLWEETIEGGPYRIICYWFNIPGDDNTVTVYKYNCEYAPAGYNSLHEWQEACPTKGTGVGFTLDHVDGSEPKVTADGKAEWTNVPVGEFSLTEDPHPGYGEPVVWCGWTAYYEGAVYDAFPAQVDATGGVYNGEITVPGTTYFCYWFNIPYEDSKITVYKYNCPEAYETGGSLENYQDLCTEWGDGIEFTLDNSSGASTKAIESGSATWNDVPQGEFTLTETIPEGYGEPVWWCGFTGYENGAIFDGFPQQVEAPGGVFTGSIDFEVTTYFCWVFNFPDYDREVTVYKWYCPDDYEATSDSYEDWQEACATPMKGIGFNVAHPGGDSWKYTNAGGKATWYGTEPGEHTLTEQLPPGYEAPYIFCSLEAFYEDGAAYAEAFTPYEVTDNSVFKDLGEYAEYKWVCHVFNIPRGPGEITIYKWYCPPGYDAEKWGANPKEECTQAQDGVPYVLDKPVGPNDPQTTGDSIPGGVYWGDLDPGKYVVSEMVPSDVSYVFIWDCVGGDIPKVHPKPLTWGNVLNVDVAGGDSIVCNWYNVPDPEEGWLTVYKYQCSTMTYKSEVDCEIYEFGTSMELFQVDGDVSQGVGNTNAGGNYTWNDLEEGAYSLEEISQTPCKVTSTKVDDSGNAWVDAGEGTIVKVYNCQSSTTTPVPGDGGGKVPGGKVPTKYPNTGVGIDPAQAPVAVPQDGTETPDASGTPTEQEAAAEFYQISCLNEADEGQGRSPDTSPATAEAGDDAGDNGGLPPFLQPSDDGGDAEATAGADATETPDDEAAVAEECERGAVPQKLVIDAANVNHEVEVLEIIDGVMQAPTGPNVVSWYKETARLGENNNIVIAAHVNWWNVPEGPFYHLQDLQEGDRIEILGEDGRTYVYEVQWVRQESNLEAPDPEVVGPTDEQSLTLITCGGEWDASISEYNERTVARAIQVEVIEPEEEQPAPDQSAWEYPLAA